jgi:hypothetical protein
MNVLYVYVTNVHIFLIDAWPQLVQSLINGRIETDNLASFRLYIKIQKSE